MRVIIADNATEVANIAAKKVASVFRQTRAGGRTPVFGLATGSSPIGTYEALAELRKAGEFDTDGIVAFALDEYVGLDYSHPESYHAVIHRTVTEPLGLEHKNVHVPDGLAADLRAACESFEDAITEAGGVDLQLLGIGTNGHIGFNEPTSSLNSRTRFKTLAPQTRVDNARFFDSLDQVPLHCLTQGIGTILDARQVVLVAQGEAKAAAVAAMIEGPLSSMCPASALQLHRDALVVIDRPAAKRLQLLDYYRHINRYQPAELEKY
ncbi:MAG: glucosamine-6-phosphate deaminase [Leucobacter sp.]|jgi:glucosamine-6-phosphate deaminase|nr:glucosamine-6-phosphate deaminase [Leucobacter sp.]